MSSSEQTYRLLISNREDGIKAMFELYAKKLLAYSTHHWKLEEDASWEMIYKTIYKVADVINEYTFENEEKFASFTFKIFINYLRNHIRDKKTSMHGVIEVEIDDRFVQQHPDTKQKVEKSKHLLFLQQELEKMEDWQRVLMLMRSQNVPYAEIRKYINKSEDQLKVYYGRIKKQLTEKLNQQLKTQQPKENV